MIINLILEGSLEEAIARKLVLLCGHQVGSMHRLGGASKIKARSHRYHSMTSYGEAVLVLTDSMDTGERCIPQARYTYLTKHIRNPHPNFLLRFAVRELESWIIADRSAISRFFQIPISKIPATPDTLLDPKRELIRLARLSRSARLHERLVPDVGHGGAVGPDYVGTMSCFIDTQWDAFAASCNSPSLARCIRAIRGL